MLIVHIHNQTSKLAKLRTDERFRHVVGDHIVCWAVFNRQLLLIDQIGDVHGVLGCVKNLI